MSSQVKIQVPIDKVVRDKLQLRAINLGFDSIQAYIRFWAKAETDGRTVDLGDDDWGDEGEWETVVNFQEIDPEGVPAEDVLKALDKLTK